LSSLLIFCFSPAHTQSLFFFFVLFGKEKKKRARFV
jgi:hypothetical protein